MGEALDASSHVIMVVSKPYKESSNCRMEASYANQLQKKGKLRIIFVMAQQHYTTVSTPDSCDGWLGVTIGDALWYPLWTDAHIKSTATEISKIVGDHSKIATNRQLKQHPAAAAANTSHAVAAAPAASSAHTEGEKDVNAAFAILQTPASATDAAALKKKLDELGVTVASDLLELDAEYLTPLAELLKPVQRKKFVKFVGLA